MKKIVKLPTQRQRNAAAIKGCKDYIPVGLQKIQQLQIKIWRLDRRLSQEIRTLAHACDMIGGSK